ncbi:putative transposase for insertion sequence element [Oscillibacter valericigenes Sjm18-20]|nr:putative transposase for insertion sequence element [Oscillibacter valericigenes Sjm18-20]
MKTVLSEASKGRYGRDVAVTTREAARASIGSVMPAKSLELRHTIHLIRELDSEIEEIESEIQHIMNELHTLSPSTYQSGQLTNCYAHMEKRGSRYLRFALFNAAKYVSGIQLSPRISPKSAPRVSTTMLPFLTPPKSLCG